MRRSARPTRRGFTLAEMIVALLVIAIAAALVVPALGGTASTRVQSAARLLAADLDYARSASIAHAETPRVVVFDLANDAYHVADKTTPDTPNDRPTQSGKYRVAFGQGSARQLAGVSLKSTSLDSDQALGFGLYGQTDKPGDTTITLACEGRTVTLTVDSTTGETRIGQVE